MLSEKKTSLMSHAIIFLFNILEITLLKRRADHRFLGARDSRDQKADVTIVVMESLS